MTSQEAENLHRAIFSNDVTNIKSLIYKFTDKLAIYEDQSAVAVEA